MADKKKLKKMIAEQQEEIELLKKRVQLLEKLQLPMLKQNFSKSNVRHTIRVGEKNPFRGDKC